MAGYYVVGNWKMQLSVAESVALARAVRSAPPPSGVTVVLCPSFPSLVPVGDVIKGTNLSLGAQDSCSEERGAYTGEVSPAVLREVGCRYVIVGHSERRQLFYETDESVRRKVATALRHGLTPILCVGETAEERAAGRRDEVVERQLRVALDGASGNFIVAYEPVWAIGSGKTVTRREAVDAHRFIRNVLDHAVGAVATAQTAVLYGGSVTAENVGHFVGADLMDGVLVGTASVEADAFQSIVAAVAT